MKKSKYNSARSNLSPVAYTNDNGEVMPASSNNPLPINIQSAIGAFTSPWKLNYSDIITNAMIEPPHFFPHGPIVLIPDEEKLYDNNIATYSDVTFVASDITGQTGPYEITLHVPALVSKIIMIAPSKPTLPITQPNLRYKITPIIVRIVGVKTPSKVPNFLSLFLKRACLLLDAFWKTSWNIFFIKGIIVSHID